MVLSRHHGLGPVRRRWSLRDRLVLPPSRRERHVERKLTNDPPETDKLQCPACARSMQLIGQKPALTFIAARRTAHVPVRLRAGSHYDDEAVMPS